MMSGTCFFLHLRKLLSEIRSIIRPCADFLIFATGGGKSKSVGIFRLPFIFVLLFFATSLSAQTILRSKGSKDTVFIYNSIKIKVNGDSGNSGVSGASVSTNKAALSDSVQKKKKKEKIIEEFDRKLIFALRSNLLVPFLNVGVQVPIGNRFSVGIDWYYPFIRREWSENLDQTNCFEALGPGVDFRYYFGKKHSKGRENWLYRLSGHSVGVFGMFGRYDWEREFWGHQANFVNVGVDYMWSSRIGKKKRMRLDMSIGVGGFFSHGTEYHVFRPKGLAYRTGKKKNITWIGPNKATISLVIPIYTKIRKKAVNE